MYRHTHVRGEFNALKLGHVKTCLNVIYICVMWSNVVLSIETLCFYSSID